jgi:large subunit ribosomal protein L17
MRHNKNFNHLGRQSSHRKALMANMAVSLLMHKHIETTVAKAKALKRYVEPIITKAKEDSTHSRRVAFSYLKDKNAVTELFRVIAPAVGERPGGYTRILKTGFRLGDAADMCFIELVDFNGTYDKNAAPVNKTRTRRSRSGAKPAEGAESVENAPEATEAKAPAKAAAKKAAPKAKAGAPVQKNAASKTSGAKAVARKSMASKKS